MTYGLAISTSGGLVVASDTRTSAGVDYVSSVRKLHVLEGLPEDRAVAVLTAGSLATTQQVLHVVEREIRIGTDPSLATAVDLWEAALHIGRVSRIVQEQHRDALARTGADGSASFIVAGRIGNGPTQAHLVYPEGNSIATTDVLSFVQIGDTKYGKSVLDRLADHDLALDDAWVLAVISIDEAVRANVSVGYPIDIATLAPDSHIFTWATLHESDELVMLLRRQWQDGIAGAFAKVDRALTPLGDHRLPAPADDPTA